MIKKYYLRQLSLILVMSVSLFSCTIQKRSFNRGYHIEWKSKINSESKESVGSEVLSLSQKNIVANENDIIHVAKESDSTTIENKTNPLEKFEQLIKKPIGLKSSLSPPDSTFVDLKKIKYKGKTYFLERKKINEFKDKNAFYYIFISLLLITAFLTLFILGILVEYISAEAILIAVSIIITAVIMSIVLGFFLFNNKRVLIENEKHYDPNQNIEKPIEKEERVISPELKKRNKIAIFTFLGLIISAVIFFTIIK
jgi:hypothetical protein